MQLTRSANRLFVEGIFRQFYRVDLDRVGDFSTALSVKHLKTVMSLVGFGEKHDQFAFSKLLLTERVENLDSNDRSLKIEDRVVQSDRDVRILRRAEDFLKSEIDGRSDTTRHAATSNTKGAGLVARHLSELSRLST